MSENENELIIGNEPISGDNIMYILPDNLSSIKFKNDINRFKALE